jgi:tetratricopeptide (TPR) repeat protein
VWTYVRLFVLPFGQNADPDVAISHGLLDHGAIVGLLAWAAVAGAAWFYRKRWPLASFGGFVYLLLIAPTSSFIPIADVLQERRLYLPFLGLALVCLEFLRRFEWKQRVMIEAPVLLLLLALTYQRSGVWGSPLALWQDSVAKSPNKVRPRFQLAEVYYEQQKFQQAVESYQIAAQLAPPDYRLLVNYGLALDQTGRHDEALAKLQQAAGLEVDPEVWTLIGQVYGEQQKTDQALQALSRAESINPGFEMTYAVRGNVYESVGRLKEAEEQYQHALRIDPYNDAVRDALTRVQRERVPRLK